MNKKIDSRKPKKDLKTFQETKKENSTISYLKEKTLKKKRERLPIRERLKNYFFNQIYFPTIPP